MKIQQVLPTVWEIDDFFPDFSELRNSYRTNQTPWQSQYPNRLLNPYDKTPELQKRLQSLLPEIQDIVGQPLQTQVAYSSLDLSGCRIMMHRLHSDIRCFVQICMADAEAPELATHFCVDADVNATYHQDYEDISYFKPNQLVAMQYKPNTGYVFLNQPRMFMGTKNIVPPNMLRETFNLHFGSPLKATT